MLTKNVLHGTVYELLGNLNLKAYLFPNSLRLTGTNFHFRSEKNRFLSGQIFSQLATNMFFRQIKNLADNFSYIVADEASNEAAVIDSSFNASEISQIINKEGFTLKYLINTHGHSDHTAGNYELSSKFGAKIVAHSLSKVRADVNVEDDDILKVGEVSIKVIYTPGHTPDSICLLINNQKLLTGDTLFVGECGRTDLPGGSSSSLYNSLFNKLAKLNDKVEVHPGHNYGPKPYSTIGEEKRTNYVLEPRSREEFIKFMAEP